MTKVNGTYAKDIALHFLNATNQRATPAIMKKTIMQAKTLLTANYNKAEIIEVIDYLIDVKGTQIYSLGYVSTCINKVLHDIEKHKQKQEVEQIVNATKQPFANYLTQMQGEVKQPDESTARNRNKADKLGTKSRFGKESFSDLFKGD